MSLIEFIGFIISMVALTFLFFRGKMEKKNQRTHADLLEEEEQRQANKLRRLLKQMSEYEDDEGEDEEDDYEPPPPRVQQMAQAKRASTHQATPPKIPGRMPAKIAQSESAIKNAVPHDIHRHDEKKHKIANRNLAEDRAYEVTKANSPARGKVAIEHLHARKDLIVIQEILGKPKSWDYDH